MFAITRTRSPLADLNLATTGLNRLFDEAFRGWPTFAASDTPLVGNWMPPVDITEDTNEVRIAAELPGVKPEDVKISLENNYLVTERLVVTLSTSVCEQGNILWVQFILKRRRHKSRWWILTARSRVRPS